MIFKSRSNYMLKYEKAKAKLVEFSVGKDNYPKFQLDSTDLIYTTIYVLSKYCEELIANPGSDETHELFSELTIVAQYYDAAVKSEQEQNYDNLFLLLGATAYFLVENFGSAKVLVGQIRNWNFDNNISDLLYLTLYFLLFGKVYERALEMVSHTKYLEAIHNHFMHGDKQDHIYNALDHLRHSTDYSHNEFDITYIDFLYSVSVCAIEHSAWILLPKYSHTTVGAWTQYLSNPESVRVLWPAQKIVLETGALLGKDLVVPLPTGVGKTKSIEIIIRSFFMKTGIRVSLVIAPLRALCNEITSDLMSAFGDNAIVNQFTDTSQEDFDLELLENTKYIFVCTPEKFAYILRHNPEFLSTIKLFIFDEAHLFDDGARGTQYELLMAEIARSRDTESQMVLFSAVLSNSNQICDWLFSGEGAVIDHSSVKSTEKSIGFLSSDQTIHYYEKDDMSQESFYVPKSVHTVQLQLHGRERKERVFPDSTPQDLAIYYAVNLCKQNGAAIFAGQVRSIAPIMRRITEIGERGYNLASLLENGNSEQIGKLQKMLQLHYGKDSELTSAANYGIFPHYANLPNGAKMAIEFALRKRHIRLVVCTTTLAEGVNIPIKYLIITTFSYGDSKIQIRKMQNLIGRTARSGIHTEGSAIVTDAKYFDRRLVWKGGGKYQWDACKKMFDYGYSEACTSTLLELVSDFQVDYEKKNTFRGEPLAAYIVDHYGSPLCFNELTDKMKSSYKEHVSQDRFERYSPVIDRKVAQLERILDNIENYLCYVYNSECSSEEFNDIVEGLASSTFAFYLADSSQRGYLKRIFTQVANKIKHDVDSTTISYYAKSLYGIEISKQILQWTDANIDTLSDCSSEECRRILVNLFLQLFSDKSGVTRETFSDILAAWISGRLYVEISNIISQNLTITQIERICSNTISYNFSFLIGNIIDAIGDRSKKLTKELSFLQKQIKYGVQSKFQILVCENIFDDRYLAGLLEKMCTHSEVVSNEFELRQEMKANKENILNLLGDYPEFFTYRFKAFLR